MKYELDTVNYDYPSCGGKRLRKSKNGWMLEELSNYQGCITGRVYFFPLKFGWTIEKVNSIVNDYNEGRLYLRDQEGVRLLKKGYKVT